MTTETEYASKGVAGTGLGLGIAGTALGLLNGGLGFMNNGGWGRNGYGWNNGYGPDGYGYYPFGPHSNPETQCILRERDRIEDKYVSKYEAGLNDKIQARDSEIAILKSEKYTDKKLVEVYTALNNKINDVTDRINNEVKETNKKIDADVVATNVKFDAKYDALNGKYDARCDALNGKIDFNKDAQQAINSQQGIFNATTASTMGCMQKSIDQLYSLTALKIPNYALCPGVPPVQVVHTALSA